MGLIGSIVGGAIDLLLDLATDPTRDAAAGEEANGWERYQLERAKREATAESLKDAQCRAEDWRKQYQNERIDREVFERRAQKAEKAYSEVKKERDEARRYAVKATDLYVKERERADLAVKKYELYRSEVQKAVKAIDNAFVAVVTDLVNERAAVAELSAFALEVIGGAAEPRVERACAHYCFPCYQIVPKPLSDCKANYAEYLTCQNCGGRFS